MPTYEYECKDCGFRFELFQKMSDPHKKTCPHCGKRLKRLIGAGTGIIFKGSGFYATDYRKQERKNDDVKNKDKDVAKNCSNCSSSVTCDKKKN